jgi:hypothetical protein
MEFLSCFLFFQKKKSRKFLYVKGHQSKKNILYKVLQKKTYGKHAFKNNRRERKNRHVNMKKQKKSEQVFALIS